ncbi:MAG: hypothetical protein JWM04_1338 [Verrucomicrobiales bacterium]|nr:hypothetical protein [Verrucomicrobiales bacterium]
MSLFLPDPNRPANPRRRWTIAVILILALGAALSAKPLYQKFKQKRAGSLLEEGLVFQRDGQLDLAYQRGRAVVDLMPENMAAYRLVAQVLTQQKKPEALGYWGRIVTSKEAMENDYLAILDIGFQMNYMDIVEKYLGEALQKFPDSKDLLKRASLYFSAKNDLDRSVYFAQKYLLRAPGDEDMRLLMSRQLLTLGQPQNVAVARTNLLQLAGNSTLLALPSIEILTRFSDLSHSEMEMMVARLTSLGSQDPKFELLARQLDVRLHPEKRSAIFAETMERAKGGTLREFAEGAKWLFQQSAFTEVLQLVGQRATENKELFLIYADSLAGLGRWKDLEKALMQPDLPLEKFFQELYLGRVALELGRKGEADRHWKDAYSLAQASPNALQYYAEYCEKIGRIADSESAYRTLSQKQQTAKYGLLNLLRLAEAEGDLKNIRMLLKEYEGKFPNETAVKNDLNYIDLLTGNNVEAAKSQAETLFNQYPSVFAFRTTLALGYLKKREVQKATDLYKGLTLDWMTLLPGWQAVYVSVLGSSSVTNESSAGQLASLINTNRLKTSEFELIKPWLPKNVQAGK